MKSIAVAVPLAPGKAEEFRRFAEEVEGHRQGEHTESRRKLGLTKELCWLQTTPQGDIFILYLEGPDAEQANKAFAASDTPYDTWFKERVGPIFAPSGVDFSQPIPPISEQVFNWDSAQQPAGPGRLQPFVLVVPLLPGKTEAVREATASMAQDRRSEHTASRRRLGVHVERVWIEHTPQGDLLIAYDEVEDPQRVFAGLSTSQEPYDVWFRELNKETAGIDLSQPPPGPPPELVLNWQDSQHSQ